jgi:hypothetical protein
MASKNRLDAILKQRNPLEERQVIKPIDVLAPPPEANAKSERSTRTDESSKRTGAANETSERREPTAASKQRPSVPKKRTISPSAQSERQNRTVLDDLYKPGEDTKRKTERYSFEIYTDQKGRIEELRYLYNKKTGKKLSVSRIIREALEEYLDKTLAAFGDEKE